jgi:dTDP-4-dehydrorhamnose reductase
VDDIAKTIDKVIQKRPTGIFHTVGSTPLSPYELALKTAEIFNLSNKEKIKPANLNDYLKNPNARPRQKYLAISNRKLNEKLKIYPLSIREALKEMKNQNPFPYVST